MTVPAQFPFILSPQESSTSAFAPYLPLNISLADVEIATSGLLDTGAAVNVLPFNLGVRPGAIWEKQTQALELSGNLAAFEARAIVLIARVGGFPPARMGFVCSSSSAVPLLLGQVNFFQEFDVCFYRSRAVFEVKPR